MTEAFTSGKSVSATKGTGYGVVEINTSGEVYKAIPVDIESRTWAIRTLSSNSGDIYIGWDSSVTTSNGFPLKPGDSLSVEMDNQTQTVYMVGNNTGDQIRYIATK